MKYQFINTFTFKGFIFFDFLCFWELFTIPNKMSVFIVRSWASSRIIVLYCRSSRSDIASRSNEPSVMKRILVFFDVTSSKRTVYLKLLQQSELSCLFFVPETTNAIFWYSPYSFAKFTFHFFGNSCCYWNCSNSPGLRDCDGILSSLKQKLRYLGCFATPCLPNYNQRVKFLHIFWKPEWKILTKLSNNTKSQCNKFMVCGYVNLLFSNSEYRQLIALRFNINCTCICYRR